MKLDLAPLSEPISGQPGYRVLRSFYTWEASWHESVVILVDADCTLGALCTLHLPERWLSHPPTVWCHESWFRRGNIDWHAYSDGSLCWDLDQRWRVHLRCLARVLTREQLARHAAEYLLNSVRSLLTRHLTGHKLGLTEWPKEWLQWSHGRAALIEFARSTK